MPNKRFPFPIKTETGCQAKWTWSTLWLTHGSTASCHRVRHENIALEDFQNFHNTPKKIADRELMLDGQWPKGGCEYCKDIEQAGGQSDRKFYLEVENISPHELETNPVATVVTPKIVEVFLNNTCNLKCVYCDPGLSSSIQKENHEFGNFAVGGVMINDYNPIVPRRAEYVDQFFIWLENNYQHIERFHILGGEPFIQQEMERCLTFWETHPNPRVTINVVSNLMIKEKLMIKHIDHLKRLVDSGCIGSLHITGSIDAWGPGAEFTRYGLDLAQFESNLKYCLTNFAGNPKFRVGIFQVVTALTLFETPELLDKVAEWRQINPELNYYFQLNTDWNRDFLHPKYFDNTVWEPVFEKIFQKMIDTDPINELKGIQSLINQTPTSQSEIDKCYIFLDEMDRRRGTNWREIFPYLLNVV
jgi:hypothetical protein